MNTFSKILLSSVVGLTSIFGGVSEAQARSCFPALGGRATICNTFRGHTNYGTQVYNVGYSTGTFTSSMVVECDGHRLVDWKSNSNMSYSYNHSVASFFCSY